MRHEQHSLGLVDSVSAHYVYNGHGAVEIILQGSPLHDNSVGAIARQAVYQVVGTSRVSRRAGNPRPEIDLGLDIFIRAVGIEIHDVDSRRSLDDFNCRLLLCAFTACDKHCKNDYSKMK